MQRSGGHQQTANHRGDPDGQSFAADNHALAGNLVAIPARKEAREQPKRSLFRTTGGGTLSYSISDNADLVVQTPTSDEYRRGGHIRHYATSGPFGGHLQRHDHDQRTRNASNYPQTIAVTLTVIRRKLTVGGGLHLDAELVVELDATWGRSRHWSIVGGGQSGKPCRPRGTTRFFVKVKGVQHHGEPELHDLGCT